jgi:hypothetical protein
VLTVPCVSGILSVSKRRSEKSETLELRFLCNAQRPLGRSDTKNKINPNQRKKVMFDITILDEAIELPLQRVEKKSHYANREQSRSNEVCQPEERLWKLSAQAVSPRFARIELFALILFLAVAVVGLISCFAELYQLLDNDAIGWIARKAAGGV